MRLRDFLLSAQANRSWYGDLRNMQARENVIRVHGAGLSPQAILALTSADPRDVIDVLTQEALANGELASSVTYIGWAYYSA